MNSEELFDVAVFHVVAGIDLQKINKESLRYLCGEACLGDNNAINFINELILKPCNNNSLRNYFNCKTTKELDRFVEKCSIDLTTLFDKIGTSNTFVFEIKRTIYLYTEVLQRLPRLTPYQSIALTGVLVSLFWMNDTYSNINFVSNFIASVFSGDFTYRETNYKLTDYLDNIAIDSAEKILTRLVFSLYILYRHFHNIQESIVELPLVNYHYVYDYVCEFSKVVEDFSENMAKMVLSAFLEKNSNNLGWLEKYKYFDINGENIDEVHKCNKKESRILINMPDGTEIGVWIGEVESIKEVATRTINNWYFSNKKINPEWYKSPLVIGKCPECGNDLILKEGKGNYVVGCKGFPQCKYLKSATDEQIKQLKIKEFKIKIHENLIERISGKEAYEAMKNYEDDFEELYDKGLSPTAAATAIIMGY